jgi:hypothetical protein
MLSLMVLLIPNNAASQAMQIVGVSMVVVLLFSTAAFIAVHFLKKSMLEGNPAFTKDSALKAQAELMLLAKKKKVEGERADDMAQKLADKQGLDAKHAEELQAAQESARDALRTAAESAIGASCPHCQIEMSADEELVVCPECGKVQHHVCFDLSGCFNGCAIEYVYEYPEEKFRDLNNPTEL